MDDEAMLHEVLKHLDPDAWKLAVRYAQRPSDAELEALDLTTDLVPAYQDRTARWAKIKADVLAALTVEQAALVIPSFERIDHRFAECDNVLDPATDTESLDHPSTRWFYTAEYPDMMVTYQMGEARKALTA